MNAKHSMDPSLSTMLPDFSKAAVLVVGDVMLDRYWFGDTSRISPEAPVPIAKIQGTDNRPGGAANVARNIAALGTKVTLLGIVGCDEAAELLKQQLTHAGINHSLYQHESLSSVIKLRVISRHQQLLRLDFEEKISPAIAKMAYNDHLLPAFQQALAKVHLLILSDYNKGTLIDTQMLIQLARASNIPVLVDPKGTDYERYRHATLLTPNRKEFEAVVGICHHETELIEKGRALLQQYAIELLLITRGEEGMTLIDHQHVTHLPAYAHDVLDVTGAGDTVISTIGAALACQVDIATAMTLANVAASIAISKLGTAAVTTTELQMALSNKLMPTSGILTEEQLIFAVTRARAQGKTVVFANGCFDVLHAGHILYLSLAKQLGDYLIVAVNTDESIRALKGASRPFNQLNDRMTILDALACVDWVVPFADATPERLVHLIKPDFLVKGGDYTEDQVIGAPFVKSYGGKVRILGANLPTSSTSLIQKIHEQTGEAV